LKTIDVRQAPCDKVFDSSKLAVIEEGSAKLRSVRLGHRAARPDTASPRPPAWSPWARPSRSRTEAIEYADGLYKAAAAAHISTDRAAGICARPWSRPAATPATPARRCCSSARTFGKAQEGPKGFGPFQALLRQARLQRRRRQGLQGKGRGARRGRGPDPAAEEPLGDQDAAIDQFGLQGLAPLILKGADAWKEYREEAQARGAGARQAR
jgi:hypothetical protein